MHLQCGRYSLDLESPVVMGVLNVTPDSFSDGGRFADVHTAVAWAERMAADGAAIIDVGGESTRPGSAPVGEDEELRRVLPVIESLAATLAIPVSIDTRKPGVMRRAIAAGATIVNDVGALTAPGAIEVVAGSDVAVCLMHMQGSPRTMQADPRYDDVVGEVFELDEGVAVAGDFRAVGREVELTDFFLRRAAPIRKLVHLRAVRDLPTARSLIVADGKQRSPVR